ncbi:Alpha/Beta hydrolase protein [Nemania abortiva]|nr:Alpha/Beta hydrolase protein [Nemania abortiva]
MSQDQYFILPDGRTLSYTTYGTPVVPGQLTLFYFHGFPGTHDEGLPFHEAASKRGIVMIGVTRPGFGGSTHQPNRDLLSFPPDLLRLADHLGVKRFAIIGLSGGGPYALACLHALPPVRLLGGVVVSGMYPTALGLAGMMLLNRVLFNLVVWVPGLVAWLVDRFVVARVARDADHPEVYARVIADSFAHRPAEDREAVFADNGRLLRVLARSSVEALRHGADGFVREAWLFGSPWGFALEELRVERGRLVLWHGAKDVNVPVRMAEKAAQLIPNAEFRRCDDEAHISLCVNRMDEVLDVVAGILKL